MIQLQNLFSFQVFFIFLRETFEISIIVAILLSIVKQSLYPPPEENDSVTAVDNSKKWNSTEELLINSTPGASSDNYNGSSAGTNKTLDDIALDDKEKSLLYVNLKKKVILGALTGVLACFFIGLIIIAIFYTLGHDLWQSNEHIFEAVMSIFAAVVISLMSIIFLRIGKLHDKIRMKMTKKIYDLNMHHIRNMKRDPLEMDGDSPITENEENNTMNFSIKKKLLRISEKEAIFFLPFITALREGLEAVVFLGGVGIDSPISSLPLSMISAALISFFIGRFFYKSSTSFSLRVCLIVASCLLYTLASGLMSKGVWQIDVQRYVNNCDGQDMTELGNGPGSYDIYDSVWHVNWGGEKDGFWVILTALFGWTNSATYGSVISYNVYWIMIITLFKVLSVIEKKGYIPYLPISMQKKMIKKRVQILKHQLSIEEEAVEQQSQPLLG